MSIDFSEGVCYDKFSKEYPGGGTGRNALMSSGKLELYIHLPFCVRKCSYCDFLSGNYGEEIRREYLKILQQEIRQAASEVQDYRVATVYFGGGTPSLLSGGEIGTLMDCIAAGYSLKEDVEITMEGNPGTFTGQKLQGWKKAGVNRLSIGCQSVLNRELQLLGRIHTFRGFQESFREAREAGFENINVDLMSGLPGQMPQDWETSLRTIGELGPEHISAYSLIVEEGTPFAEMDLQLPGEELERQMYEDTEKVLAEYGYSRYEISNYASDGRECRHNIGYWKRENYLGFGLGAASLLENVRFSNRPDMEGYLKSKGEPAKLRQEIQRLSKQEQMEEFMFLGLRMTEGVSEEEFRRLFSCDIHEIYGDILEKYQRMQMLECRDGRIFLTKQGIFVSNPILADFLL